MPCIERARFGGVRLCSCNDKICASPPSFLWDCYPTSSSRIKALPRRHIFFLSASRSSSQGIYLGCAFHKTARQIVEQHIELGLAQFAVASSQMPLNLRLRQQPVQAVIAVRVVNPAVFDPADVDKCPGKYPVPFNRQFASRCTHSVHRQQLVTREGILAGSSGRPRSGSQNRSSFRRFQTPD